MPHKKPTLGQFLFDYFYKKGIHHAFGIPGDFALPMFRWLDKSDIDLITMTHEPSVGFAADAYARINGLGLACVTYCVGGLNMVNSIACAYAEKSPVIVVSGAPSMADRQEDQLIHHKVKTFDTQRRIYEEVTYANTVLHDPETAADEIVRMVALAKQHCRPVYIEVPFDMVDKPIALPSAKKKSIVPLCDNEALDECLREATAMINKAKKPVLIADIELHRHGLTDMATEIAHKFNIPIAATMLSKSIIRETNPLYIGVYSGGLSDSACQEYVESSDCVVMLGAFVSDVFLGWYTAHMERRKTIVVTTEKVQVGLHNYQKVPFTEFLKGLDNAEIKPKKAFKNPNIPEKVKPLAESEYRTPLTAEAMFRIIGTHIGEGSTLVCDTGDALVGAIGLRTLKRKTFISDAYYLSMGFAVPAGIGAIAATKEKGRVFVLVGDGAFQMTGMELSTAAKYGMKPIVIIINNDGFGTQRHIIDGSFNDIHRWNYTKIREVLGYGKAIQATTMGAMEKALKEAVETDEMVIIEAVVPRNDCSPPLKRLGEALGKLRDVKKKK